MTTPSPYKDELSGRIRGSRDRASETASSEDIAPRSRTLYPVSGVILSDDVVIDRVNGFFQASADNLLEIGNMDKDSDAGSWQVSNPTGLRQPTAKITADQSDLSNASYRSLEIQTTSVESVIPEVSEWTHVEHSTSSVLAIFPYVRHYTISRGTAVTISVPPATRGVAPYTYSIQGSLSLYLTKTESDGIIELTGTDTLPATEDITYTGLFRVTDSEGSIFDTALQVTVIVPTNSSATEVITVDLFGTDYIPIDTSGIYSAELVYQIEEPGLTTVVLIAYKNSLAVANLLLVQAGPVTPGVFHRVVLSNLNLMAGQTLGFQLQLRGAKGNHKFWIDRVYVERSSPISAPESRARVGNIIAG